MKKNKPNIKKETELSVLIEIRELLKQQIKSGDIIKLEKVEDNLVLIEDDGTKTTSELLKAMDVPYWSYLSDKELDEQFPKVKTSRKFKWIQEADSEYANKSANDLANDGKEYMTLRERLIFELLYFKETGKHPDEKYITLCAGSRYANGNVPRVYWCADCRGLSVDWFDPQDAGRSLRARAAVSNP